MDHMLERARGPFWRGCAAGERCKALCGTEMDRGTTECEYSTTLLLVDLR